MSNKDCDLDGLLDMHYGYAPYSGSGAHGSQRISPYSAGFGKSAPAD